MLVLPVLSACGGEVTTPGASPTNTTAVTTDATATTGGTTDATATTGSSGSDMTFGGGTLADLQAGSVKPDDTDTGTNSSLQRSTDCSGRKHKSNTGIA